MRQFGLLPTGIIILLIAAGLFALTLRKPEQKSPGAPLNKSQQREAAAREEELKKMRLGAGILAGIGVLLMVLS
jgi:hypothetical protein